MVQREVTKKTRIYGSAAVLSAIVLVSLIFVFGAAPGLTPLVNPPPVSGMKTFADESALRNYLVQNTEGVANFAGPLDSRFLAGTGGDSYWVSPAVPSTTNGFGSESATKDNSYSTTNIQVAGVDEADTVKTDGSYLYVSSDNWTTGQNYISIVKADPSDPQVIAKITLENNTYLAGMYLSQDSSKLIVVGSTYSNFLYAPEPMIVGRNGPITVYSNVLNNVETFLNVYDISDKVHPTLAENFTLSGSYFNSRMIGDYVYAVVSQPAYVLQNNDMPLPTVYANSAASEVAPSKIYYSDTANYVDVSNNYFTYTTFLGLNVQNSSQPLTNMTVLMGGASTMYVSLSNIYVAYPTWNDGGEYTSIYRVSIDESALSFEAEGVVGGSVLNQYSLDEYNGNFRLATTNWKETTQNAVYVLDQNLTTVGSLQLANTELRETIQSARFIGNRAYIVTYEQHDPFFVLDLSNPAAPQVAGKLEIPGYSSYLHPYDDNHIIGIGKENNFVKLSLFDVSNVNSPTEIAKFTVNGVDSSVTYDNSTGWPRGFDYSDSQALYEPKAFLFDKQKNGLLVIPISTIKYGELMGKDTTYWGQTGYWDGAYVFKLTLNGFELVGGVTQQDYTTNLYVDNNLNVNRALYIGNTLYTVSNSEVQLNSLTDLSMIATVQLS